MERHEDESAKAFDAHLTRRLLKYLRPYRLRAGFSVLLIIFSSVFELAGPAITAIGIDLFVLPNGAAPGFSARVAEWLAGNGIVLDRISGINVAAGLYLFTL